MKTIFNNNKKSAALGEKDSIRSFGSVSKFVPTAVDSGYLVTTNGYAISAVLAPCEGIDNPVILPLASVEKGEPITVESETVSVSNRIRSETFRVPNVDYPDFVQVFPDVDEARAVTLNVDHLRKLVDSLAEKRAPNLTLLIGKDDVIGVVGARGIGVVTAFFQEDAELETRAKRKRFSDAVTAMISAMVKYGKVG